MSVPPSSTPPQGQPQGYGPPPGQQGGYGGYGSMPSAGYGGGFSGPPVPNYKGWSITNIVLGVLFGIIPLILGVIALTNASRIDEMWRRGDRIGAEAKSRSTRTLNIVGTILAVIGAVFTVFYIIYLMGDTTP